MQVHQKRIISAKKIPQHNDQRHKIEVLVLMNMYLIKLHRKATLFYLALQGEELR